MSDLVGNPEDRFSRVEAHMRKFGFLLMQRICAQKKSNEPVHEKTNNLGFRPGPTQTRLYSHRNRLEA